MAHTIECSQCGKARQVPQDVIAAGRKVKFRCPTCEFVMEYTPPASAEPVSASDSVIIPITPPGPGQPSLRKINPALRKGGDGSVIRPEDRGRLSAVADARPLLERNTHNAISVAESVRDSIYDMLDAASKDYSTQVLLLKSPPFSPTVWVKMECWNHRHDRMDLTDRCQVIFTVNPKPFHRYPTELDIEVDDKQLVPQKLTSVVDFTRESADAIVAYALRRTRTKLRKLGLRRFRQFWWQFWRPKNDLSGFGTDWLKRVGQILLFGGMVTGPLVFLAWLVAVPLLIYCTFFRKKLFLSSGRPAHEPRLLHTWDSWHSVLPELGDKAEAFIRDLHDELRRAAPSDVSLESERIWHWGIDGKEERVQHVLRFRRGQLFLHVYAYGKDLFVGWDAHINSGSWGEQQIATGIDHDSGQLVSVSTIQSVRLAIGEYDVIDVNCLIGWAHATMRRLVKRYIDDFQIDADVDFTINRVERGKTGEESGGAGAPKEKRRFQFPLRREA